MTTRTALWTPGTPGVWTNVHDGSTVSPPAPPSGFQFSVIPAGNGVRELTQEQMYQACEAKVGRKLGGLVKYFDYGNGINTALLHQQQTPSDTGILPVYCIKQYNAGDLNAWLNTLTTDAKKCYLVWDQEFYSTSQAAWDTYNAGYLALKNLLTAHANGARVQLQAVSSMASERPNPGYFTYADETLFTRWGADSYNAKTNAYTATQLFADQKAAYEAMKVNNPSLKWIVSEYGLSRFKDAPAGIYYTGPERVAKMQAHIDYLLANGCSGLSYWAGDNESVTEPVKDWSIDKGTAADDYFAAYLGTLIAQYPVVAF